MRTVVMRVDGNGVIWAISRCRVCGEVHRYLAADAIANRVACKSCKRPMEIQGAVIAATDADPKFREVPDEAVRVAARPADPHSSDLAVTTPADD